MITEPKKLDPLPTYNEYITRMLNHFSIDGGIIDRRLDDEPTDEKIRITNMRLDLKMQMEGMKQCKNCFSYNPIEMEKCQICDHEPKKL